MAKRGFRKPRKKRPAQGYKNYDSEFEYKLHKSILKKWSLHSEKVSYVKEHTYLPDFVRKFKDLTIFVEAKGRFWDSAEYGKYVAVREALDENQELVFLFYNPDAPMPRAKMRRDGTKRSHREWAEANGFRWFDEHNFPKEWR